MNLPVRPKPGVMKCHLLHLRRFAAANLGRFQNRSVKSRDKENRRIKINPMRLRQYPQVRLENIKPEATARLQMPQASLKHRILLLQCGKRQKCIEKNADPIKCLPQIQRQGIASIRSKAASQKAPRLPLASSDIEHVGSIINPHHAMPRLSKRNRRPARPGGNLQYALPTPRQLPHEKRHVFLKNAMMLIFAVVVFGNGTVVAGSAHGRCIMGLPATGERGKFC